MEKLIISHNENETKDIAKKIGSLIPNGSTILLLGDLGAGKTTFVRGLAEYLHIKETVQSPTFNIMKIYLKGDKPLIHIDAYRLADNNFDIGLDEYIGYETGITVIEWPMYIENLLPKDSIKIDIKNIGDNSRNIKISNCDQNILEAI